jgi:hypothetical protein
MGPWTVEKIEATPKSLAPEGHKGSSIIKTQILRATVKYRRASVSTDAVSAVYRGPKKNWKLKK